MLRSAECQIDNGLILIRSSLVKHAENILPARPYVACLRVDHLSDTSNDHIAN